MAEAGFVAADFLAPLLNADLAIRAARHYRRLREPGITIRQTADIVIGTFCIERRHVLLHDNRDFDPMVEHLGLCPVNRRHLARKLPMKEDGEAPIYSP